MSKLANYSLLLSGVFFTVFFLNVVLGAFGHKAPLNDIHEMLTLFAAAVFFAAAVLQLEANAANSK